MELGGNAASIVFDDANIDAVVEGAITCTFKETGQIYICDNRFYIHKSICDEFSKDF